MSLGGHFEKVTVGWSEELDEPFGFTCAAELIVNKDDVSSTITEVLRSVVAVKIDPDVNKQLSIPLGMDTVRHICGHSAVQLKSGFSLVIEVTKDGKVTKDTKDTKDGKVFKRPFNQSESSRLELLLH